MCLQISFSFSFRIDSHLQKNIVISFSVESLGGATLRFQQESNKHMTERSQKKPDHVWLGEESLAQPGIHPPGHAKGRPMLVNFCSNLDPWSPERSTLNPQSLTSDPQPLTFKRHSSTLNPQAQP